MIDRLDIGDRTRSRGLIIPPTVTGDTAVEMWMHRPADKGLSSAAVCTLLDPPMLRRLAADLIARADLIDPPTIEEPEF